MTRPVLTALAIAAMASAAAAAETKPLKALRVACHTPSQDQKGPDLGNLAQTCQRPELAQPIRDPNQTIAQGFTTNMSTIQDGAAQMGFVTHESGDKGTIRNLAAQEFTLAKAEIAQRDTRPTSIMPPGLMLNLSVREFAYLLDTIKALAKAK